MWRQPVAARASAYLHWVDEIGALDAGSVLGDCDLEGAGCRGARTS
ncbi:MAG: hypothetical protein IKO57_11100 [Treponema sp.]|nr:hypothetical protein [Treponema sp.]MBR4630966.1 hypothetical protein [Treponema sp.]MBR6914378.1 hypothetical protein [Treponema sp.]